MFLLIILNTIEDANQAKNSSGTDPLWAATGTGV